MTARFSVALIALLGIVGLPQAGSHSQRPNEGDGDSALFAPPMVSDSALDELSAGRYWHAARMLRTEGAAQGSPADVLTLARAEAGWENWPAVLDLLDGVEWLADLDEGRALYLNARALEHAERWTAAAERYGAYVDRVGADSPESMPALARRARAAWSDGNPDLALASLGELRPSPVARSWAAVELALAAVDAGDLDGVRALAVHAIEPAAARVLWRAEADALLNSGDSAAAARAFRAIRSDIAGDRRATVAVELGRLLVAAGDTLGGRALLLEGLDDAEGSARGRAAASLIDLGGHDLEGNLGLARILDRAGDGARALLGYDRALAMVSVQGVGLPEVSRLERARLMSTVRTRQDRALDEFRGIRETTENERIGARNLEVWARMRSRQGLTAQVNTLRRWLIEEYPSSNEAAEVVWSQGGNAEARGALGQALERYTFLAQNARTHARAGQARMRSGQIHLRRTDLASAAEVFEKYLEDFPTGRRWQEAAYWAGRTRMQLGDSTEAVGHLDHVLSQPVEYYAVMAADLLGVPFAVDVPVGEASTEPGWLTEGLSRLDVLTEAGLERGASSEIARLRQRADGSRGPMLRLAEALIERGRTIDGINLGWRLLERGSWDQQLLRVTYPFPYRELVRREAEEWGVDPFMMAAIIRQESAFKADIVSRAGAIGLMQVMPPTGAQLARTHGPNGFTEESLTKPEVNLHLGAAFFVDMSRRYDDELPLVLSAYNAGPTRATRWRRYPEVVDALRFTERIPIVETRGYVKSVRRNLGLYRALYGQD